MDKEEFEIKEPGKEIPLFTLINREQLLYLALEILNADDIEEEFKEIAASITHWYIINEIAKNQKTFTEDNINDRFNDLITTHILNGMIKKGFLEENIPDEGGESTFRLTPKGQYMSETLGVKNGK